MKDLRAVVVDDSDLIRDIVSRTLTARGIDTVAAEDAVTGFRAVEQTDPHLAVIDVMLPGEVDGVGLCKILRKDPRYKNIVIVMITASDKRREATRSLAAGADVLIAKPFSPKQFWVQVGSMLKDKRISQ
jgi:DNA-binding response OmpR family regulator